MKCRTDITAIQEMRSMGQECKRLAFCDVYDSCHVDKHEFGYVFVCYYGLNRQLSSRHLSRSTKLILYKALIIPWTLVSTDAAALRVFERKVLRKIFCPVQVVDDFHTGLFEWKRYSGETAI